MNITKMNEVITALYVIEHMMQAVALQKETVVALREIKQIHKLIGKKVITEDHVNFVKVKQHVSNGITQCILFALNNPGWLSDSLKIAIDQLPFDEYAEQSAKKEMIETYIKKYNASHYTALSATVFDNMAIIVDNKHSLIENSSTYALDINSINSISALQSVVKSMHDSLQKDNQQLLNAEKKKAGAIMDKYLSECSYAEMKYIEKYIAQYKTKHMLGHPIKK